MGKSLYIAEKPSVAKEFAKALKLNMKNQDGYMESDEAVVTWCVGHLVTMSYPEAYRPELKRWSLQTIPFIPTEYKYEVIPDVEKQFKIVASLLNRKDVTTIYVCTDSGREGEYIYRLVERQAGVTGKERRRVWIDSQTEEEILRGIREAKELSEYDDLCASAYLRAQEDYLMGINFSRVLTLKYGNFVKNYLKADKGVISVGRVMTCVLGMVVDREREIRNFVKTPFYRIQGSFDLNGNTVTGEWKAVENSPYFESPLLYKENGFAKKEDAEKLISELASSFPAKAVLEKIEKKTEKKNPPLLYNLAELQNDCSKLFKISPDDTLKIAQELYEKKLTTYPRTDARVLSTAVAKEIDKNIGGLKKGPVCATQAEEVLNMGTYKKIASTKYVNDKQITDHYAIIPTGQGFGAWNSLSATAKKVYEIVVRRFLAVFYPPAVYQKLMLTISMEHSERNGKEYFFAGFKVLAEEGYQKMMQYSFFSSAGKASEEGNQNSPGEMPENADKKESSRQINEDNNNDNEDSGNEVKCDQEFLKKLSVMKKGTEIPCIALVLKEGETSPPKRYNSGSMILAMENAGQLIEDDDLRAQIKGSGIGTSATRAGILTKLFNIKYLALNKKTQIITPTLQGELIYDVVYHSIASLLDPKLTASWEKGLTGVADGTITKEEYTEKMDGFVTRHTNRVKDLNNQWALRGCFDKAAQYYKK